MSKHFELMQQLDRDQKSGPARFTQPAHTPARTPNRPHGQPTWANDEALRLVQQIFSLQSAASPRTVVFAGVDHGSGCSQISASVAETLAKDSPGPVCLVEANFRTPSLTQMFGMSEKLGLADALLKQELPISSFTTPAAQENLWLLPAGAVGADSPNLLSSKNLRSRLLELREDFDYIIIDAPPLTPYSEGIALGQLADGLVLVLEAEATRREAASVVATNLRSFNISILAAVLNKRTYPIPDRIYSLL